MTVSEQPDAPTTFARFARWAKAVELGRRLAFALALGAVFFGLLTYAALTGSAPFGPDPKTVLVLLLVDLSLILSLAAVVSRHLVQLWIERRRGSAGSRLHTRMVGLFSVVAVAPAILVAIFSALFFNFGLQGWFSDRVRTAVMESVAVAEAYSEEHRNQIRADVLAMASEINRQGSAIRNDPARFRQVLREQALARNLPEAIVFDRNGSVIARSGLSFSMEFDLAAPDALARAATGETIVITSPDGQRVRALVRLDRLVDAYLYVGRFVDAQVLIHADNTRTAVNEYQRLESERSSVQIAFALIFIVVALLLLLAAVFVALTFASRLVGPVSNLVQAAERIRGGDLSARVPEGPSDDEIGSLSRAFNRMTSQLEGQRGELIDANRQLDMRRRFTEAVLSGVSSGVIGLTADGRINLSNRTAVQLLDTSAEVLSDERLVDAVPEMADLLSEAHERRRLAQGQVTITRKGLAHTLLVRITADRANTTISGFVVTFDDVTALLAAQRNAAWADIARRIAHEIKNPLTPIQLSAERLRRKYLHEVGTDPEIFEQCTDTIIRQVGDIGRMIDEFSSFARMPSPVFRTENLVELVRQALFLQQVAHPAVNFRTELPVRPVPVVCDARQVSQVLTNLMLNAAQAIERRPLPDVGTLPAGDVLVRVVSCLDIATLEVQDNGCGLPDAERNRLTEPYFTTRARGTGLGLAIVAKVVEDHRAKLTMTDRPGGGAVVAVEFPAGEAAFGAEGPGPLAIGAE